MFLQPESAGNAHPEAGHGEGRVAMEIQPMSHLQPCKWLMCHGSFSRRSREKWELRENIFKCLQQGRAGTVQGQMLGVLSVCGEKGAQSTAGQGSAAFLGCLRPEPFFFLLLGQHSWNTPGLAGLPLPPPRGMHREQLSLTLLLQSL